MQSDKARALVGFSSFDKIVDSQSCCVSAESEE